MNKINEAAQVFVTAKEIAKMLGVSRRTIWRWDTCEKVPEPIRIGKAVRWRRHDIEEWVKDGCPPRQPRTKSTRGGD